MPTLYSRSNRRLLCTCLALAAWFGATSSAYAFDYLEHLWFTDDACRRTQQALASEVGESAELLAPYLALALACPVNWERPYCEDEHKSATAGLNRVPPDSRAYAATLGDYSALGDHVSRQGPIRNLPRAGRHGLVESTLRWMTDKPRGLKGPIGAVAQDACRTKGRADLVRASDDIDRALSRWWADGELPSTPAGRLVAAARATLPRGPHDPPMKYSYDNPHYLDMVLRNHHHFGDAAHDSWNGFHGAATQMRHATCKELIVVDADEAEDLADHVPGYQDVDWDDIAEDALGERVCGMLREVVRQRLSLWAADAPDALTTPVAARVASLARPQIDDAPGDVLLLDAVVVNTLSLVFEGTGLHYLQDSLAGGHMRTIRSREALVEVRHDHDADNRDGVAAALQTPQGTTTFVAWGDGYLLGRSPATGCEPTSRNPAVVATCLLQKQRGMLSLATIGSLLDWALRGPVYSGLRCSDGLERAICMGLPVSAANVASALDLSQRFDILLPGSLPVPPPHFSYESLSVGLGYAPFSAQPFLWTRFAAYAELDMPAHWLTSWQIRLESDVRTGLVADVGFGFHYRIWARAMLDMIPVVFMGVGDLVDGPEFFAGVMPRIGLTVLPEGWLKIPIEFGLHVDLPLVMLQTNQRAFAALDNARPRAAFAFGLAFMH